MEIRQAKKLIDAIEKIAWYNARAHELLCSVHGVDALIPPWEMKDEELAENLSSPWRDFVGDPGPAPESQSGDSGSTDLDISNPADLEGGRGVDGELVGQGSGSFEEGYTSGPSLGSGADGAR
jgi:hypothetical protein